MSSGGHAATFDWYAYFELAQELAEREDEACRRSAVSRAYYAVYCNARNRLDLLGEFAPEKGSEHAHVWDTFEQGPEKERVRIGQIGRRLREVRNRADYDDHIEYLSYVVEDAMIKAGQLKAALQSL